MILEADLKMNSYYQVKSDKEAIGFALKHVKDKATSSPLKLLIEKVMLSKKKEIDMTMD